MGKQANEERVRVLFRDLRAACTGMPEPEWLAALERDALALRAGWHERFDGYLHALAQCGAIGQEEAMQWIAESLRCRSHRSREQFVFITLWTVLVSLTAVAWQSVTFGGANMLLTAVLLAGLGGFWTCRHLAWHRTTKQHSYAASVVALALSACFLGLFVPGFVASIAKGYSFAAFKKQQAAFASDPSGLAWIRQFAKREYGVDVVLAAPSESWTRTALLLEGSSPAYMATGSAWCELGISRASLEAKFSGARDVGAGSWEKGIMLHELAHCLDVQRDFQSARGGLSGLASVAPGDRKMVTDGPSYYQVVTSADTTQLWQEALADVVAVGFWRLNENGENARKLIDALREIRTTWKRDDPVHASGCWITEAAVAPAPASNAELFNWADRLRSTSRCPIGSGATS